MAFDDQTLAQLAQLARLELPADGRAALARELAGILDLVDALKAINVDGVTPLAHPHDAAANLRPDRAESTGHADALLALSPDAQGGYYTVPRVVE
jgi:aspartyl-tRNA(Asn)/glutamyl-tRNA(Gln) amidotransferase subunit C